MPNIRRSGKFRLAAALVVAAAAAPAARAQVSGKVTVTEAGGKEATDVGNAVVYLDRGPRANPVRVEMTLDGRNFSPRVTVVPVGSTVVFPNRDPFNHNVFSLSDRNSFDLGLYGRGEKAEHRFRQPGVVSVFCNIHPRMVGFILVRDNTYFTQPGADGSFAIPDVPAGSYTLHVWHERAPEVTQQIVVPEGGLADLNVALDASGYKYVQHKNKYGREYGSGATRERY